VKVALAAQKACHFKALPSAIRDCYRIRRQFFIRAPLGFKDAVTEIGL
jgi:hypothetical protein